MQKKKKQDIIKYIQDKGYGEVTDFGSKDPIYANVAIKVAEAVANKKNSTEEFCFAEQGSGCPLLQIK